MTAAWLIDLGVIDFKQALDVQRTFCFKRAYAEIPDVLLLAEHPHVYSTGRRTDPAHISIGREEALLLGADIVSADRGGSVTYHGPGQLVVYPILNLGTSPDLHRYLRDLEKVVIHTLSAFGIEAVRIPDMTGVWAGGAKIASIGVKVTRGITKHGFSLNIDPDMSYFDHINACGFSRPATSMRQLLETVPDNEQIREVLVSSFESVFQQELVPNNNYFTESARDDSSESAFIRR